MEETNYQISLGLVTYNQYEFLKIFMKNYIQLGQNILPLIIVDDGSDDETQLFLSSIKTEYNITVHNSLHQSIAHARNLILKMVTTPWVAFSDTDCLLNQEYFRMVQSIPKMYPRAIAVEGAVHYANAYKPAFTHSLQNEQGSMYVTANMIFHVSSVLKLGGFDPQFKNFREDVDLALRITSECGPIPFEKNLIVYHPHVPRKFLSSLKLAWKKQSNIFESEILLYKKHPNKYKLVRYSSNAKKTISNWFFKYLFLNLNIEIKCIQIQKVYTPKNFIKTVKVSVAILTTNLWEQICIIALCLLKMNKILGLKN